jgi:hypothetical protein
MLGSVEARGWKVGWDISTHIARKARHSELTLGAKIQNIREYTEDGEG